MVLSGLILPFFFSILIPPRGTAFLQGLGDVGKVRGRPSLSSRFLYNEHNRRHFQQMSRLVAPSNEVLCYFMGACFIFCHPMPANAVDETSYISTMPPDVSLLNREYLDPLHPKCRRTIEVDKDGKTFHYSGTDVGPQGDLVLRGCSPGEIRNYGLRTSSFDGTISQPELRLSVGDGIHEGIWESANSIVDPSLQFKAVDGIRWNDGNKWIVKEEKKSIATVVGEWIFLAYIGFSTLAGVKGVWDKLQEKKNRTA